MVKDPGIARIPLPSQIAVSITVVGIVLNVFLILSIAGLPQVQILRITLIRVMGSDNGQHSTPIGIIGYNNGQNSTPIRITV